MARRKKEEDINDLAGTVEGQSLDHFEREKREYEERTGETVHFVPPTPLTRTPIETEETAAEAADSAATAYTYTVSAEGEE